MRIQTGGWLVIAGVLIQLFVNLLHQIGVGIYSLFGINFSTIGAIMVLIGIVVFIVNKEWR